MLRPSAALVEIANAIITFAAADLVGSAELDATTVTPGWEGTVDGAV
jgi:hypothetical protein